MEQLSVGVGRFELARFYKAGKVCLLLNAGTFSAVILAISVLISLHVLSYNKCLNDSFHNTVFFVKEIGCEVEERMLRNVEEKI